MPCLQLTSYWLFTKQLIQNWRAHTDFSVLRTLKLRPGIEEDALDDLATECRFPSLATLVLNLNPRYSERRPTSHYLDTANRLLRTLPPLSTLELQGWHHDLVLHLFLDHHGSALHKLEIWPFLSDERFTQKDITEMSEHCPLLEDLTLPLHLPRGDATEVALYKTLGSFPRLRHVSLRLITSNAAVLRDDDEDTDDEGEWTQTPNDPSFDAFDQQFCRPISNNYRSTRNGHLRDALTNSALDQTLASAIFTTISSGKPVCSLPLRNSE